MITKKTIALAGSALALALVAGTAAMAHHSGALYDAEKLVTFNAVVKNFEWTNPHIRIYVIGDAGTPYSGQTLMVESTSTAHLTRGGWTRNSLKPGDHIEFSVNPSKTGSLIANLRTLKNLETGQSLSRPTL